MLQLSGLEEALEYFEIEEKFSNQKPKEGRWLTQIFIRKRSCEFVNIPTHDIFILISVAGAKKKNAKITILEPRKAYNICMSEFHTILSVYIDNTFSL